MNFSKSRNCVLRCALGATAITAFLPAMPAAAQDLPQEEPAFDSGAIVVTARRREESLQETPVAISAFSAEQLQARQINQTQDLEKITPSLQFKPAGQLSGNSAASVVFIRGVGQVDPGAPWIPASASISTRFMWAVPSAAQSNSATSAAWKCCAGRRAPCSAATRSAARS